MGERSTGRHQLCVRGSPFLHTTHRCQLEKPVCSENVPCKCSAGDPGPEHHHALPEGAQRGDPQVQRGDRVQGGGPDLVEGEGDEVQPREGAPHAGQMCHLLGTGMG